MAYQFEEINTLIHSKKKKESRTLFFNYNAFNFFNLFCLLYTDCNMYKKYIIAYKYTIKIISNL